jgi:tetratricopeptide (TPR) repeat protein
MHKRFCLRATRRLFVLCALLASGVARPDATLAQSSSSWLGGWLKTAPSTEQMLRGKDPQKVQQLANLTDRLNRNPNDTEALDARGQLYMQFSEMRDLYWSYWQDLAAKDLERAVQLDAKDFTAWLNYGLLNFEVGDMWWVNDHSNARRSVWAYTHAIELNPNYARAYVGRGWAYVEMGDEQHANADFQKALQLDPTLKPAIDQEVAAIRNQKAQEPGARAEVQMMGDYWVATNVHDPYTCKGLKGVWMEPNQCRFSRMLNPAVPPSP